MPMNEKNSVFAFTSTSNGGLLNRLATNVLVELDDKKVNALALWDTGATNTCISVEVVNNLGLIPTGKMNIKTPSGSSQVNTYLVNIILPNNVRISDIMVCDSEIGNQGIGVLIGMDIINKGDFTVSNFQGKTAFSFRIPSQKKTDYVIEANIQNKIGTHGKGKRKK